MEWSGAGWGNVGVITGVSLLHEQECLSGSPPFSFAFSLSAITASHPLPIPTGRQTLKSFLIMRETTEKRTKLQTSTLAQTRMHMSQSYVKVT